MNSSVWAVSTILGLKSGKIILLFCRLVSKSQCTKMILAHPDPQTHLLLNYCILLSNKPTYQKIRNPFFLYVDTSFLNFQNKEIFFDKSWHHEMRYSASNMTSPNFKWFLVFKINQFSTSKRPSLNNFCFFLEMEESWISEAYKIKI